MTATLPKNRRNSGSEFEKLVQTWVSRHRPTWRLLENNLNYRWNSEIDLIYADDSLPQRSRLIFVEVRSRGVKSPGLIEAELSQAGGPDPWSVEERDPISPQKLLKLRSAIRRYLMTNTANYYDMSIFLAWVEGRKIHWVPIDLNSI